MCKQNCLTTMQVFVEELEFAGCKARNLVLVVMDVDHPLPIYAAQTTASGNECVEALRRAFGELGSLACRSAGEESCSIPVERDLDEIVRIYG